MSDEIFGLHLADGFVTNYELFEKFGKNFNIGTGTDPEDVWNGGGEYTGFPTQTETLEISSDNAADTAGSGTGAWTVEISGLLDATFTQLPSVTVSLDGNPAGAGSWVSLGAGLYHRAGTRIKVKTAGTLGANVGSLTLRHTTTTANIFAVVPPLLNRTAIGAWTVPLGKTLYINRLFASMARASGAAGSANVSFRSRQEGGTFEAIVAPLVTSALD